MSNFRTECAQMVKFHWVFVKKDIWTIKSKNQFIFLARLTEHWTDWLENTTSLAIQSNISIVRILNNGNDDDNNDEEWIVRLNMARKWLVWIRHHHQAPMAILSLNNLFFNLFFPLAPPPLFPIYWFDGNLCRW